LTASLSGGSSVGHVYASDIYGLQIRQREDLYPRQQFSEASGIRKISSHGFHTFAASCYVANGEDVARENVHAEVAPQLQQERKQAPETAGGAYASRDSPRAEGE